MEREFLCEKVELTTWDDISEMHNVSWKAEFRTGDLERKIEMYGDGIPEYQAGHSYIFGIQQVT
jgi:hypothetical protein